MAGVVAAGSREKCFDVRLTGKIVQCSIAVPQHLPLAVQRGVFEVVLLMPLDHSICREQRLADGLMEPLDQLCNAESVRCQGTSLGYSHVLWPPCAQKQHKAG